MTDAYDIYMEVLGKVNKEENGYLPASLFNAYARAADRYVFNDYIARLQNPQTAAVEKQKLEDRLAPFEKKVVEMAVAGLFTVPDDCAYFRGAKMAGDGGRSVIEIFSLQAELCEADTDPTINVAQVEKRLAELTATQGLVAVELKDHDQIVKRVNSYVPGKKPTLKKPVMERAVDAAGKRGFLVYPGEDMSVFYNYYRRPAFVNLVMEPDQTLELIYNKKKSIGFEWEEEAMTDVVNKIVTDFSIYIREGGLFQMTGAEAKP